MAQVVALVPVAQKPPGPLRETREAVEQPRPDHLGGDERAQPDHRADGKHPLAAALDMDNVVVEPVRCGPKSVAVIEAAAIDGRRDIPEMLEELRGDILIG